MPDPDVPDLAKLVAALGDDVVVTEPDRMAGYRFDRAHDPDAGRPLAVVTGASSGIGYLMVKGQSNISTSIVMAGMIAIGIVGFAVDVLLRRVETGINRRRGR